MLVQVKIFLLATFIAVSFAQSDWSSHKKQFGLDFRSIGEEQYRQVVYAKNLNAINEHNQRAATDKSISYTRGVNKFTHLTYEELIAKHTGFKPKNSTMRAILDASNLESERVKRQVKTTSKPCSCTCGTTVKPITAKQTTTVASKSTEVDWRGTIRVGPVKDQGSCG
jgi:C1A family cysteine protease